MIRKESSSIWPDERAVAPIAMNWYPETAAVGLFGALYTTRMIEFVEDAASGWRPDEAIRNSESLSRSVQRLHDLYGTSGGT